MCIRDSVRCDSPVKVRNKVSQYFEVTANLRKGCFPWPPTLFKIYITAAWAGGKTLS